MSRNVPRYSAKKVASALLDCDGNVTATARKLRCSQVTINRYAKRYPTVAEEASPSGHPSPVVSINTLENVAKSIDIEYYRLRTIDLANRF